MKIYYLGHSAFKVEGNSGSILIDPFIKGNPSAKIEGIDLKSDLILVSHGHGDHLGDAVELSKEFQAPIVSVFEIANFAEAHGASSHGMHIGGGYDFPQGRIKLTMALHGSSQGDYPAQYLGNPCGFIINMDGITLYHAGDTGLFGDMALLGRLNQIDMAFLPIGDNFTMGPEDALEAVKLLQPKTVIPMHYNTWELIQQDPYAFKSSVEANTDTKVLIMVPGESTEI